VGERNRRIIFIRFIKSFIYFFLKMKAVGSPETLIPIWDTTQRHVSNGRNLSYQILLAASNTNFRLHFLNLVSSRSIVSLFSRNG
jgi:hypothetical protein